MKCVAYSFIYLLPLNMFEALMMRMRLNMTDECSSCHTQYDRNVSIRLENV